MTDRPILFSAPMVRAILAGTKTQTRRVMKEQPQRDVWPFPPMTDAERSSIAARCPYGVPGDRLWVRETWTWNGGMVNCQKLHVTGEYHELYTTYAADGERRTFKPNGFVPVPEQPPIRDGEVYSLRDAPEDFVYTGENTYMDRLTRWWERKIPSIHMPRWASRITLEITDVRVERLQMIGVRDAIAEGIPAGGPENPDGVEVRDFRDLWLSINGAGSWEADPWVWVVEFKRVEAP